MEKLSAALQIFFGSLTEARRNPAPNSGNSFLELAKGFEPLTL
jgi:hypothetical protein